MKHKKMKKSPGCISGHGAGSEVSTACGHDDSTDADRSTVLKRKFLKDEKMK